MTFKNIYHESQTFLMITIMIDWQCKTSLHWQYDSIHELNPIIKIMMILNKKNQKLGASWHTNQASFAK